jgi:hypothetical protein
MSAVRLVQDMVIWRVLDSIIESNARGVSKDELVNRNLLTELYQIILTWIWIYTSHQKSLNMVLGLEVVEMADSRVDYAMSLLFSKKYCLDT